MSAHRITATPLELEWQPWSTILRKGPCGRYESYPAEIYIELLIETREIRLEHINDLRRLFGRLTARRVEALRATLPDTVTLVRNDKAWRITETDLQNWVEAARQLLLEPGYKRPRQPQPAPHWVPAYERGPRQPPVHNPVLSPDMAARIHAS